MDTDKAKRVIVVIGFICLIICLSCSSFADEENSVWKMVYEDVLDNIEKQEPYNISRTSTYLIYDMDGNDTPELIIMKGLSDAERKTEFYTCEDDKLVRISERKTGYVDFEADDTGEGLIIHRSLDEEASCKQILLKEKQLIEKSVETPVSDTQYRYLKLVGLNNRLPISLYEEIIGFVGGEFPVSESVHFPEFNDSFFDELIDGKGVVQVIPGMSSYYPDYQCKFEMLKSKRHEIGSKVYSDTNGDGQLECIVELRGEAVPSRIFLSEQNGVVYAYIQEFAYSDISIDKNGNFLMDTDGFKELYRLIFEKGEWFLMNLPMRLAQ